MSLVHYAYFSRSVTRVNVKLFSWFWRVLSGYRYSSMLIQGGWASNIESLIMSVTAKWPSCMSCFCLRCMYENCDWSGSYHRAWSIGYCRHAAIHGLTRHTAEFSLACVTNLMWETLPVSILPIQQTQSNAWGLCGMYCTLLLTCSLKEPRT
jgi:hypothetical protein